MKLKINMKYAYVFLLTIYMGGNLYGMWKEDVKNELYNDQEFQKQLQQNFDDADAIEHVEQICFINENDGFLGRIFQVPNKKVFDACISSIGVVKDALKTYDGLSRSLFVKISGMTRETFELFYKQILQPIANGLFEEKIAKMPYAKLTQLAALSAQVSLDKPYHMCVQIACAKLENNKPVVITLHDKLFHVGLPLCTDLSVFDEFIQVLTDIQNNRDGAIKLAQAFINNKQKMRVFAGNLQVNLNVRMSKLLELLNNIKADHNELVGLVICHVLGNTHAPEVVQKIFADKQLVDIFICLKRGDLVAETIKMVVGNSGVATLKELLANEKIEKICGSHCVKAYIVSAIMDDRVGIVREFFSHELIRDYFAQQFEVSFSVYQFNPFFVEKTELNIFGCDGGLSSILEIIKYEKLRKMEHVLFRNFLLTALDRAVMGNNVGFVKTVLGYQDIRRTLYIECTSNLISLINFAKKMNYFDIAGEFLASFNKEKSTIYFMSYSDVIELSLLLLDKKK